MSKLFSYKHSGIGGCNKTAFFTLSRPQPGQSLANCVVISTEGKHVQQEGALFCGSCDTAVMNLKINDLKPARMTNTVDLLVAAINGRTVADAEIQTLNDEADDLRDMCSLLDEACTKIHPDDLPKVYNGSELQDRIHKAVGIEDVAILGTDGQPVDKS